MRARGLVAYDTNSLATALTALTAEKKDSDEDGTPDIAELMAGTDPNTGAGDAAVAAPEYGCAVSAVPSRASRGFTSQNAHPFLMAVLVALGLVLRKGSLAWEKHLSKGRSPTSS